MKKTTAAIQGIKGAFHEEAAVKHFGEEVEIIPCLTFGELSSAVAAGIADYGVMAIENSISGTILSNLELIRENSLSICAEMNIRIVQNLGVVSGTKMDDIREVHSHYMALNQCREFFIPYRQIKLVESADTALSIRDVSEWKDKTVAAIGSKIAIEKYGLDLIAEGIETNKQNYTRFAVVAQGSVSDSEYEKVSLSLILAHKPGSLAKVLSLLHLLDINLTKLESVPIPGRPWNYRFYIDFIMPDPSLYRNVLRLLKEMSDELIIMGRYKTQKEE